MLINKTNNNTSIVIQRDKLKDEKIDIRGRDILIGFNEPAFKFSQKNLEEGDLDSKLNARFISYFLPAIEIAKKQERRPRLLVVSGLNMALKWNAETDDQRKIMMINNNIKLDFIRTFFENFFSDSFSIIEYIVAQDPVKISEDKLLAVWKILERKKTRDIEELRRIFARYKKPQLFNSKKLSQEAKNFLNSQDENLINAFKYAIAHLFVMADINFEGNYIHNPIGYLTIGGPAEQSFNILRKISFDVLKDIAEIVFEREVIYKDNLKLILEQEKTIPPAYNGYFKSYGNGKKKLYEVTFENNESLDFYMGNKEKGLDSDINYIFDFISRKEYEDFWNEYGERYLYLKKRYREAYDLKNDF